MAPDPTLCLRTSSAFSMTSDGGSSSSSFLRLFRAPPGASRPMSFHVRRHGARRSRERVQRFDSCEKDRERQRRQHPKRYQPTDRSFSFRPFRRLVLWSRTDGFRYVRHATSLHSRFARTVALGSSGLGETCSPIEISTISSTPQNACVLECQISDSQRDGSIPVRRDASAADKCVPGISRKAFFRR